jgi:excinuclease ABC subunit A
LNPDDYKDKITVEVFTEILARLDFLVDTGLSYLKLNRPTYTLSRGEFQRINLAFILGSTLSDSLLILDQPSSDLHPGDYEKLASFLFQLKENGNTLLIIEHNREIVKYCDYLIELGPGSGAKGGNIVFSGTINTFLNPHLHPAGDGMTLTQKYFNRSFAEVTGNRTIKSYLSFKNACTHNLKNIDFKIPVNAFTTVTGVSGAGKTTLLYHEIYSKHKRKNAPGLKGIKEVLYIDPAMDSVRGDRMIADYFDLFSPLRNLFAGLKESRILHYKAGHFSIHSNPGRCEQCKGKGYNEIQMQFLPSIAVPCETCDASGYKGDILKIHYKGNNIRQFLDMPISDVIERIKNNFPSSKQATLKAIVDNGLGHIKLGQPLNRLAAGEKQRIKLLKHLHSRTTHTLFLIDEPTFGLHPDDIERVKNLLDKILDLGNTIVAAEHNLQLITHSDYMIQLGPEGGDGGGEIVYQGKTSESRQVPGTITHSYLKKNSENT